MRIEKMLSLLSLALLWSCGQGALEVEGMSGTVEHALIEGEEIFYVSDAVGVALLEASEPFDHVEFHVSLADAEIRALDAAGRVVVDWADVASFTEDSDPVAFEGTLELPEAASLVELRMRTEVDFARVSLGTEAHVHESLEDDGEGAVTVLAAYPGRYIPPPAVVNAGNQQYLPYTGAPSRCAGTFRPGTRQLAQHLQAKFLGGRSYGGYNCRANTANPGVLSVHASGRAIDLFVPVHNGQADNDLGDPIANYLIQNAQRFGIEFIVWDRTSWGAHRAAPKHRAYSGPHPHHDHLHIELAPWAANGGIQFDQSPRGYLDSVTCGGISGWAQDPDAPHAATSMYISIGGPVFTPGATGADTVANENRGDLCTAIGSCNHGWYVKVPHGLMDGVAREVHAYAHDATGGDSSAMTGNGKTLRCNPPSLPYAPAQAVKRHIINGDSLKAWGFQWNDIIKVSDSVLSSYATGAALPARPKLRRDGPAVYVVEGSTKRHVPNPRAMRAWGFDWGAVQAANLGSVSTKRALEQRPYLVKGSGPAVYLIWPK